MKLRRGRGMRMMMMMTGGVEEHPHFLLQLRTTKMHAAAVCSGKGEVGVELRQ